MAVSAVRCFEICTTDLNKKATLEKRVIQAPTFGNHSATPQFTVILDSWFNTQTLGGRSGRGVARFAGVNINDQATHLYTTRYSSVIKDLDAAGEHFIRMGGRLFRVLEITDLNEENRWIIFQCTERGLDTQDATGA